MNHWMRRFIAAMLAALTLLGAASAANVNGVENFERGWAYYTGRGVERDVKRAVEQLEIAARQTHTGACYALGCIYRDEEELRDPEAAAYWFEQAALLGDTDAMCALGELRLRGEGVAKDPNWARFWFETAGRLGNAKGYDQLGERCMVAGSYRGAAEWFVQASKLGDAAALGKAAQLYYVGKGVGRDEERAIKMLTQAADAEDPESQYLMATLLYERDSLLMASLYVSHAAKQGHAAAQYRLGEIYEKGIHVDRDPDKALLWYGYAAEQGYYAAQRKLVELGVAQEDAPPEAPEADAYADSCFAEGERYLSGDGVAENEALALQWYRKAAERGHAGAMRRLAQCLVEEFTPHPDLTEAADWLRRAAELGDVEAQYELGCLYAMGWNQEIALFGDWDWDVSLLGNGDWDVYVRRHPVVRQYANGVEQDLNEAAKWFDRASRQGDAESTFLLGVLYETGRGMPRDVERAAECYRTAAEAGSAEAEERLANLTGETSEPEPTAPAEEGGEWENPFAAFDEEE